MEFTLPNTHVALVTNDGSDLTSKVIAQLETKGNKVVALNLPNQASKISTNGIDLESHSDEAVKNAIEKIRTQYGEVGSFIHLHPHFEFQNGNFVQHFPAERQVVKTLFFLAKHLQKPLNDLGQTQRANLSQLLSA